MKRFLFALPVLSCIIIFGACKEKSIPVPIDPYALSVQCPNLDETKLESVIQCFYSPGKTFETRGKWWLLSNKSREETTQVEWEKPDPEYTCTNTSALVLGEEARVGFYYARIAIEATCRDNKKNKMRTKVITGTWVREDGKWRKLVLTRIPELTEKKLHDGDYAAAIEASKKWLDADPFSVEAYQNLYFSFSRSGPKKSEFNKQRNNILRSLLAINPKDSGVLFMAATLSDDRDVAKSFLIQLKETERYRVTAISNVASKISNCTTRLKFLQEMGGDNPSLDMQKAICFATTKKFKDLKNLLTDERTKAIREHLNEGDASYAAIWATQLSRAMRKARDNQAALEWIDYALTRDPSDTDVVAQFKALKKFRNRTPTPTPATKQ